MAVGSGSTSRVRILNFPAQEVRWRLPVVDHGRDDPAVVEWLLVSGADAADGGLVLGELVGNHGRSCSNNTSRGQLRVTP